MPVTGCTKDFWCVWNECTSYNNGSGCSKCEKFGTCEKNAISKEPPINGGS